MDHHEVGRHWNSIATTWTSLTRNGYDIYRDRLNTPAFLEILPDVRGLHGLDIGCGEGYNTRKLAERGACMYAVDISDVFIHFAAELPSDDNKIGYAVTSAVELPFANSAMDFCTGFMSFMDIPELDLVFHEVYRVLKPLGFLQFSITHPCYDTPHRVKLRDASGDIYAFEIGDYFRNLHGELISPFGPDSRVVKAGYPSIQIPRFTRTISQWFNTIIDSGFVVEKMIEPMPSDELVQDFPQMQDAQVVAHFLHIRARKPAIDHHSG